MKRETTLNQEFARLEEFKAKIRWTAQDYQTYQAERSGISVYRLRRIEKLIEVPGWDIPLVIPTGSAGEHKTSLGK